MTERAPPPNPRKVRSYVLRAGRITAAQENALDRLWPRFGIEFDGGRLDFDQLFGRTAPVTVEIGFGNGEQLSALAQARPQCNFLGIEVHRPGVGRLLREAEGLALANLRVICHDAAEVFARGIEAGSLDEVLVLFPDPWHKKRHHKRRLIQPQFVALIARSLRTGGALRLATDWQDYAEQMQSICNDAAALCSLAPDGGFVARPAWRIRTRFEQRGRRLGHGVWDLGYLKSEGTAQSVDDKLHGQCPEHDSE
ncbi:MAG: tRNA (guanosine(46)-N7)-methyltransferase TrmB [Steroidobacteraceae bacterium]